MTGHAPYPSGSSIERAAELARIPHEPGMQDWPIEVANAERLDEFLALLRAHASDWELTFWFVDLVLESARDREDRARWASRIVTALVSAYSATKAPSLQKRLEYWACEGDSLEDAFEVAPIARRALEEIRRLD